MRTIPNPYGRTDCFFCGSDNPVGLKLTFHETDAAPGELICLWTPSSVFTGFGKVLHGGIQSGLFDEIMGWAALHLTDRVGVTLGLNVEFLKPVFVEQEIEVRCRIASRENTRINLTAEIRNEEGNVCTRATGTYVLMAPERFRELVGEE